MRTLYVGDEDFVSKGIIERLVKEENDVFILTNQTDSQKRRKNKKYKYYYDNSFDGIHDAFLSINPKTLIFAGAGYIDQEWGIKQKNNLSLLALILEECKNKGIEKFIFLSSTEVYGNINGEIDETSEVDPNSLKGIWLLQCEYMIKMYKKYYDLNTVILRVSSIFRNKIILLEDDLFGCLCKEEEKERVVQEIYIQPVHISDLADAVKRVMVLQKSDIYNVCNSYKMKLSTFVDFLTNEEACSLSVVGDAENRLIHNKKIKSEQEWVDFWNLETLLHEEKVEIHVEKKCKEKKCKEKKTGKDHKIRMEIRRVIENIIIFIFFAVIYITTAEHSLFSQVNWLLIYVMVMSLSYSVRHGTLAVVLASAIYLIVQEGNIFEITNFYSYVGNVLVIVEFIFFGLIIGYRVDMMREENRIGKEELEIAESSYENLKEINQKNILIKNEYEKRVLDGKNGLPKLYAMIRKINVLDEDRIFIEILNIIKELMNTDTVAVYKANKNSDYLRLIATLNEESLMEKRSWDLRNHPNIREAIAKNMIFEGDVWENEPAIVLPIVSFQESQVVIVIKELSFQQISLYSINMIRTLLLLISESMEKAFQYDLAVREKKYIKNTDILYANEFEKILELAREKERRKIADYRLVKIPVESDIIEVYDKIDKIFRSVDFFGIDKNGDLFVLLANTSKEDEVMVIDRLCKNGVLVERVQEFQTGASE